jgi:hypothetical protein
MMIVCTFYVAIYNVKEHKVGAYGDEVEEVIPKGGPWGKNERKGV